MSFSNLHWCPYVAESIRASPPHPLQRTYIRSQTYDLELVFFTPSQSTPCQPLLFAHGGYGSASVWYPYMLFFAARNIPCYAISYRGHGNSTCPGFLQMVYGTTKGMLANDLVAGVQEVERRESERKGEVMEGEVVLVGHSSGGGLAQYVLSEGMVRVKGLVLLGSVPGFGSLGVYKNWWFRVDPFFMPRVVLHLWHPTSPLSTDALVKRVFFSDEKSDEEVAVFRQNMAPYESYWWPMSMMWTFADAGRVLQSIKGWNQAEIMEQLSAWYRSAFDSMRKTDNPKGSGSEIVKSQMRGEGVRFEMVEGAGHHVQNDVQWEDGALKILDFYEQL
ncbi:alpha/beta-hydrolase [Pseudovirgaria hyperparasitica]|uniref:Alpha/beta-hydrolase n=1 Tax=Pseudovirgaria hyperparasitica TaxID=470096 RepID=A0A6A6VXU3_9PEZI|nr:alpha/beta-hydrolase [Pseudovirgaria hyperparasitica]KAF2754626.1 alpha/beta-hydrolase [Pseudovirgaria hyperparasitica]